MKQIQKQIRKTIKREAAEWLHEQDAWLGDFSGVVETGVSGILWARLANGNAVRVHNSTGVPADFDLHVKIGENRHLRKVWQILRVVEDYDTPASGGRIGYHHTQHEFMQPDSVWIDRRQIIQLSVLVSDAANFKVTVYGAFVHTPGGVAQVNTTTLDLSAYIVTVGALFVNIEADDTGALSLHVGTNFGAKAIAAVTDIPTPDPGKYIVAVVLLYEAQTELSNDDVRVPMPLGVIPKTAGLQIGEATEGTPALTALFGYWDVSTETLLSISLADLMDRTTQYNDGIHTHGLARWEASGGATFELPDLAERLNTVSDNGSIVDPLAYSLSADGAQLVFDSSVTAGHIVTAEYLLARI
jgi:hypothetical protein